MHNIGSLTWIRLYSTANLTLLQYNIKKKEEIQEMPPEEPENPLMRKKKTPEELAREAEEADQDEFTSEFHYSIVETNCCLVVIKF